MKYCTLFVGGRSPPPKREKVATIHVNFLLQWQKYTFQILNPFVGGRSPLLKRIKVATIHVNLSSTSEQQKDHRICTFGPNGNNLCEFLCNSKLGNNSFISSKSNQMTTIYVKFLSSTQMATIRVNLLKLSNGNNLCEISI